MREILKELKGYIPEEMKERLAKQMVKKQITDSVVDRVKKSISSASPLQRHLNNVKNCLMYRNIKINTNDEVIISGRYCRSRFCIVCQNIRTAKYISKFEDVVKNGSFSHLVLTVPNVENKDLKNTILSMKKVVSMYNDLQRKNNIKNDLIYSIEITYNSLEKNFHPHIHAVINTDGVENLKSYWLNKWIFAKEYLQKERVLYSDDPQKGLFEIFKYITKIGKYPPEIYSEIYEATYKKRMFEQYGLFRKVKEQENNKHETTLVCTLSKVASNYMLDSLDVGIIDQNKIRKYEAEYASKGVKAYNQKFMSNELKKGKENE